MAMLEKKPNPFGDSRVDNPFQKHVDLSSVYNDEYQLIKTALSEIKNDKNAQSKGVAVVGEPGTGKTHLMMRLANEVLKTNRLLFIRQPNNPGFVLYHIYSRILESLVEKVPGTPYSQIEHLLSKSFSKIIINTISRKKTITAKDQTILDILSADHMNIYKKFGGEGTETKRRNWKYIESKTLEWWSETYGFGGFSLSIIKGLIRFCSYTDPAKRELVRRWLSGNGMEKRQLESIGLEDFGDQISKEAFSLEAITVFGKLSIEDEPLVIVFDQLEGLKYNETLLLSFGEAVKEIFSHLPNSLLIFNLFPDRWEEWQVVFDRAVIDRLSQYRVYLNTPEKGVLKSILSYRAESDGCDFSELFTKEEIEKIVNGSSIRSVLNSASEYFRFKMDGTPLPRKIMTFEEEMRTSIQQLNTDIASIKNYLNMSGPSFEEMEMKDRIDAWLNENKMKITVMFKSDLIINDADESGKMSVVLDAFSGFLRLRSDRIKTGKKAFPEYVMIKKDETAILLGFLNCSGNAFTGRIKNFTKFAEARTDVQFILVRDSKSPLVKGKVAKSEIEKLNTLENAYYRLLNRDDRFIFELLYLCVIDTQNRDLDVNLKLALNIIMSEYKNSWLSGVIK